PGFREGQGERSDFAPCVVAAAFLGRGGSLRSSATVQGGATVATVDTVIPVYNEEHVLEQSVTTLHAFLSEHLPHDWRIVVADNASTDGTLAVAKQLKERFERVDYVHLDQKGRGRALRATWLGSRADVVSYMDVDLSSDIKAYPALIRAITDEGY